VSRQEGVRREETLRRRDKMKSWEECMRNKVGRGKSSLDRQVMGMGKGLVGSFVGGLLVVGAAGRAQARAR
jgi:hypothetical protein